MPLEGSRKEWWSMGERPDELSQQMMLRASLNLPDLATSNSEPYLHPLQRKERKWPIGQHPYRLPLHRVGATDMSVGSAKGDLLCRGEDPCSLLLNASPQLPNSSKGTLGPTPRGQHLQARAEEQSSSRLQGACGGLRLQAERCMWCCCRRQTRRCDSGGLPQQAAQLRRVPCNWQGPDDREK